jgi:hypothetical protein
MKTQELFFVLLSVRSLLYVAGLIHKSKTDRREGNKTRGGAAPPLVLQTTYDRIQQTSINCKFRREQMPDYFLEETKYAVGQRASSATDQHPTKF